MKKTVLQSGDVLQIENIKKFVSAIERENCTFINVDIYEDVNCEIVVEAEVSYSENLQQDNFILLRMSHVELEEVLEYSSS